MGNDLDTGWEGDITLQVRKEEQQVVAEARKITVPAMGREIVKFTIKIPPEPGDYQLTAELHHQNVSVKSIREFNVE